MHNYSIIILHTVGIEPMSNETNQRKINVAIKYTKLRLNQVQQEIMFMIRQQKTLEEQLESLEIIRDSKDYE